MTAPKKLTPAEALRALADGKKLCRHGWDASSYVRLGKYCFVNEMGNEFVLEEFCNFIEYTKPRRKMKVAPYIIKGPNAVFMSSTFYRDDHDALVGYPQKGAVIRRVTELEVEVEE